VNQQFITLFGEFLEKFASFLRNARELTSNARSSLESFSLKHASKIA